MESKTAFDETYTEYAPATRSTAEEIERDNSIITSDTEFAVLLDKIPDVLMMLNSNRQIVYVNSTAAAYLGRADEELLGLKPGEALECKNAYRTGSGCGTSEHCTHCGAVNAIMQSLKGVEAVNECRIAETVSGNSYDFRVWASPVLIRGISFTIFVIKDIADEKRRSVLERIFFHDILNLAGSLKGISYMLKDSPPSEKEELLGLLSEVSESIISEIQAQKMLLAAESNSLVTNPTEINTVKLLNDLAAIYRKHDVSIDKEIVVGEGSWDGTLIADSALLRRVLSNMLKNALEASMRKTTITLSAEKIDGRVVFSVHNQAVIPHDIKLQIFQRSFSTKGNGRGLGTYSIKLLTERYLGGTVRFESSDDIGTTFYAEIPVGA